MAIPKAKRHQKLKRAEIEKLALDPVTMGLMGAAVHVGGNAAHKAYSKTDAAKRTGARNMADGIRAGMMGGELHPMAKNMVGTVGGPEFLENFEVGRQVGKNLNAKTRGQQRRQLKKLRKNMAMTTHLKDAPGLRHTVGAVNRVLDPDGKLTSGAVGHVDQAQAAQAAAERKLQTEGPELFSSHRKAKGPTVMDRIKDTVRSKAPRDGRGFFSRLPWMPEGFQYSGVDRVMNWAPTAVAAGAGAAAHPVAVKHMALNGVRQVAADAFAEDIAKSGLKKGFQGGTNKGVRTAMEYAVSPAMFHAEDIGLAARKELHTADPAQLKRTVGSLPHQFATGENIQRTRQALRDTADPQISSLQERLNAYKARKAQAAPAQAVAQAAPAPVKAAPRGVKVRGKGGKGSLLVGGALAGAGLLGAAALGRRSPLQRTQVSSSFLQQQPQFGEPMDFPKTGGVKKLKRPK